MLRDNEETFPAIVLHEQDDNVMPDIEQVTHSELYDGPILIKVSYTSLNYKDMLAFQKHGGVIRHYPMIPGIDAVGEVVSDKTGTYAIGEQVIVTGTNMGVTRPGALAAYVAVEKEDVVPLPTGLTPREAMIYGTAGYTAAQSLLALLAHGLASAHEPEILVTGATGGVGSVALALLHQLDYHNVTALIRKNYQADIATQLGANHVLMATDLSDYKPLASAQFDYILDSVGGNVAGKLIPQIKSFGAISMCGNAAGIHLETSVLPMILRGVNILGINSIGGGRQERLHIWNLLATEWKVVDHLYTEEITLNEVVPTIKSLKNGGHLGRTIVKI